MGSPFPLTSTVDRYLANKGREKAREISAVAGVTLIVLILVPSYE